MGHSITNAASRAYSDFVGSREDARDQLLERDQVELKDFVVGEEGHGHEGETHPPGHKRETIVEANEDTSDTIADVNKDFVEDAGHELHDVADEEGAVTAAPEPTTTVDEVDKALEPEKAKPAKKTAAKKATAKK